MQGTRVNVDGGVRFPFTERAERARDQSYPLTIGIEGATKGSTELGKKIPAEARKVCFCCCYLRKKQSERHGQELGKILIGMKFQYEVT